MHDLCIQRGHPAKRVDTIITGSLFQDIAIAVFIKTGQERKSPNPLSSVHGQPLPNTHWHRYGPIAHSHLPTKKATKPLSFREKVLRGLFMKLLCPTPPCHPFGRQSVWQNQQIFFKDKHHAGNVLPGLFLVAFQAILRPANGNQPGHVERLLAALRSNSLF